MTEKKIILAETIGISRRREFIRIGVPFAKGALHGVGEPSILSPEGKEEPVQTAPLSYWKDGSIKWLLLDFCADVPPRGQAVYRFIPDGQGNPPAGPIVRISQGTDTWQVDTGAAVFVIDAREFRPFVKVSKASGEVLAEGGDCGLRVDDARKLTAVIDSITVGTEGPLRVALAFRGKFAQSGREAARFAGALHFIAGSSCVRLDFTIHNPQGARHPGGLWDLGDPGSFLFRELALTVKFAPDNVAEIQCSPESGAEAVLCCEADESLSVYQESSGGENWLSPVHRNREGRVPFTLRGYEISKGEKKIAAGSRATPVMWCGSADSGVSVVLPRFWQEFPKALAADRKQMKIGLFPGRFPDLYELQGGEQKTHTIYLDFCTGPGGLDWARSPVSAIASADDIRQSRAVYDLPHSGGDSPKDSDLLDRFISGPDEFFQKREAIDEYGWRNFGDIFADHEGVYHKGADLFVSHYNNQYDICAGMYRKYMATGDRRWGELASDLARHVLDVDIYHTDQDREEYNHGLFWHTDHYIPAGLSTHRSFSREQIGDRDPRFCGGGPASEHCYASGLMYHYFLTGESAFRDAVVRLADWCYWSISGTRTVLGVVKKAGRYVSLLRNSNGAASVLFPRCPLSRGTGNAISACLDAYEVTGDGKFLDRAFELIRGTVHPNDDLDARNLLDAENAWSYTVMLAAVIKYLVKLEEREDFGEGYRYARACLSAYAEWMSRNEYPYLDKPEILEYPNETWPAQDVRKAVILYHAAKYSEGDKRGRLLERARFFYDAARDELDRHSTSGFTRPLALIFQNGWIGYRLNQPPLFVPLSSRKREEFGKPTPELSLHSVARRVGGDLIKALVNTSLKGEMKWLKHRMAR